MKKQNIVVIGAGKGIGLAIVKQLKNEAEVFAYTRSKSEELEAICPNVFYTSEETSLKDSVEKLPEVIDGLVFCPGSIRLKPFHRIDKNEFLEDYTINVLDAIEAIQIVLPRLKKSAQASVVLFSSVAAQIGMTFHASISSAKAALEGLTKSLAAEYAPTIRFNCIAPSLTQTSLAEKLLSSSEKVEASNQRHPLKRIGQPEDLASLTRFLLLDATWMTGQIIHLDGGMGSVK